MPEPIPEPLWSLMLATNDCYPGCGCEADRFDMTPLAVAKWVQSAKPAEPYLALDQLRSLIVGVVAGMVGREAVSAQTNVYFGNDATAVNWLRAWERLLESASHAGPEAVPELKARADLAQRFERKGKRS